MNETEQYNKSYANTPNLFGSEPESTLVKFAGKLPSGLPILDLGVGQGRHALFLARKGFHVHAVDPSRVALDIVKKIAEEEQLSISMVNGDISEIQIPEKGFGGILIYGLLQILNRDEITDLLNKCRQISAPNSLMFITAWTVADSSMQTHIKVSEHLGMNSFRNSEGGIRTYFEEDELKNLLSDHDVLHYEEGLGKPHRHGDGPIEQHGRVEAVFRRRPIN